MDCPRATITSEDCDHSSHSLLDPFAYPGNPHQSIINQEVTHEGMVNQDSRQHVMCQENPLPEPMQGPTSSSSLQNQKIPVATPDVLQLPSTQVPYLQVPRLQPPASQTAGLLFPGPDILRLSAPCFQGHQAQDVLRFGPPSMQAPGFQYPQPHVPPLDLASDMDMVNMDFMHNQLLRSEHTCSDTPSFHAPTQVGSPSDRSACKLESSETQGLGPDLGITQHDLPHTEVPSQQILLPPQLDVTRGEPLAGPSSGLTSDADVLSDGSYGEQRFNPGVFGLPGAGPGPQGLHPGAAMGFPYPMPSHLPPAVSLHPSFLPGSGPPDPALARAYLQQIGGSAHKRKRSEKKPIPEEQKDMKYYEKRARNNGAAKRSRDLRKQREENMAIRASMLERQNQMLRNEIFFYYEKAKSLQQAMLAKMANAQR